MHKYKIHKTFKPRKHSLSIPQGISKEELEVRNFIALEFPGTPVYESNRTILHGRELDIYIPTKQLAIEFDGLFWHNDKSPSYHLWKTIECEKQGIQLLHIFSDEWENRKPIVIDLIRKTLGKYQLIEAEQCKQVTLSKSEGVHFINACDIIEDNLLASTYKGLYYNNDLVAVLSYSTDEQGNTLIHRYSERRSIKIHNGINSLIQDINSPITVFLDRRLYNGLDYIDAGFNKIKATDPDIWYTSDFKSKYRAQRLTESQIHSFTKIYDCGSIVLSKQ